MTGRSTPVGRADLAPLNRRLALLQVLRLALALSVTVASFVVPGPLGDPGAAAMAALGLVYSVASVAVEVIRRRRQVQNVMLVGGLLLFDGVYLAVVTALTGGPESVLSFLVLMHVIAVTLLLSFRSGLKVALWQALLLIGVSWLHGAGVVKDVPAATPEQAAMLGSLALLVVAAATALFSSLNEGELRRGKAELRALAGMASRMAATTRPAELVHSLLTAVSAAFVFPRAAVVVGQGGDLRAFVLGSDGALEETVAAPGTTEPTVACASPSPRLVRALDEQGDRLLARVLPGAANVVVIPLVADGHHMGTLAVERAGGRQARVAARTVDVLGQFAAHAALALRAAALQAEVERMADTDALTGLANRRVFQEALARELALAVRRGERCGLIVIDVDHFKSVNDNHGHQAGDEVLRQVGRALATAARETDIAARYGGEEFAVILPNCAPGEAILVSERLRAAIAAQPGPVPVTVSSGVATFPSDATDGTELVAAADHALYRAKRLGRDRSVRFRRPRRAAA